MPKHTPRRRRALGRRNPRPRRFRKRRKGQARARGPALRRRETRASPGASRTSSTGSAARRLSTRRARTLAAKPQVDRVQANRAALRLVPAMKPARVQALIRPSSSSGTWSMIMRSQAVSSREANRLCRRNTRPIDPSASTPGTRRSPARASWLPSSAAPLQTRRRPIRAPPARSTSGGAPTGSAATSRAGRPARNAARPPRPERPAPRDGWRAR